MTTSASVARDQRSDFVGLAAADEQRGVRTAALALHLAQDVEPGARRQQAQFGHAFGEIGIAEIERDQDDALAARVPLKQGASPGLQRETHRGASDGMRRYTERVHGQVLQKGAALRPLP